MMKKIWALVLAVVMVMTVGLAFADGEATLTGGEVGGFTTPDKPTVQNKTIILKKELTAYNVDGLPVKAPTITYTYEIDAGTAGLNVTDATSDHNSGVAVTTPTLAGVGISDITITGTSANTIVWGNTDELTTNTAGSVNTKDLKIDFSKVVFNSPGVYRYVITETGAAGSTYAATGVTETTGTHVRYLDVYVKPADSVTSNGTIADDWDIYGYVCIYDNEAITPDGDTTTTGAMKTNGFVSGTNDNTEVKADSYYTYNLTVSKTVTNDAFGAATHQYPFTVIFTNATINQSIDIIGSEVAAYVTGTAGGEFTEPAAGALSAGNTKGVLTLKDKSSLKYVGIPMGTSVEVYETNDVTGVTYQVSTSVDSGDAVVDNAVTWGTKPSQAIAQAATKNPYESTKATITTSANTDDDKSHTIALTNNLQLISPTGVVLRVAPYVMILVAGIALLILAKKRKPAKDEE